MNQHQLLYFLEVYQLQSIKKAAKKLIITPQGISKTLLSLEKELNASLFVRTKKGLIPTNQAHMLKPHAEKILNEFSTIQEKSFFMHTQKDFLKILSTAGVLDYLGVNFIKDFQKAHTEILLNFTETTDKAAAVELLNDEIELSLLSSPVDTTLFSYQALFSNYYCIIVNRKNPLAQKAALSCTDFKDQPLVLKGREQPFFNIFQENLIKNGIRPNTILETNVDSIIADIAEQNLAIGGSLDYLAFQNKRPHTVIIPLADNHNMRTVYLAQKHHKVLTPQAKAFKDFLLNWLEWNQDSLFHWNALQQ
ncbi:LysR family transcriptional regulator [Clostridium estertheticum]|uniref:LysR family transcriptional regulator n=1 Tax=Clostridium estertheticum TaxID=238834 RepID=UPI001C0DFA2D|nr:LysR family transcriptional regulator [Clostridium estertheticum]MBU3072943.1 LysR family transcriptional regulator [Clostridium estertheticum]MBU3163020.1 LysR family transcriptional regulator [Clostridium estertheticum]MBU3183757.1 LysR family transcriptional regulator [Clostridium estertheticum]